MAKKVLVSAQILIANYKAAVNDSSGIEAGYIITPQTDSVSGLKIYARIRPNVNRVDLLAKDSLDPRGITETVAKDKFMANLAAIKTFFALTNVGETAAALDMPQIKLDSGGVFWDTTVTSFPQPTVFSTNVVEGTTTDPSDTHKYLNYFTPSIGDFSAKPVTTPAAATASDEGFFAKYKRPILWGVGVVVVVVGFVAIDPFKWFKKKSKNLLKRKR
ncbi:hypothetical protein [Emticicia sp. BO119]|uniref:hypothetical protein n=1 Tax=Emticicia sp. BO119 TaxID=2757768 RepID=UPI0015F0C81F|nr:hypothetical protein [Emticicia sp. BO119]MBA4849015.1 hypothetical protein [Emticicia sp. BO119]